MESPNRKNHGVAGQAVLRESGKVRLHRHAADTGFQQIAAVVAEEEDRSVVITVYTFYF